MRGTRASGRSLHDGIVTLLAEVCQKLSLVVCAKDLFGLGAQGIHLRRVDWHADELNYCSEG